jgi:hypothetical protein
MVKDNYIQFIKGNPKKNDERVLTQGFGEGLNISEELYSKGKHIPSLAAILDTGESLVRHLNEGRKYTINPEEYISKINDLIDRNVYNAAKKKNSLDQLENYLDDISKLRLDFTRIRYSQNSKYSGIESLSRIASLFFFFLSFLFISFQFTGNVISNNFLNNSLNSSIFFLAIGFIFAFIWIITKRKIN